jgi:hypothetical protein
LGEQLPGRLLDGGGILDGIPVGNTRSDFPLIIQFFPRLTQNGKIPMPRHLVLGVSTFSVNIAKHRFPENCLLML